MLLHQYQLDDVFLGRASFLTALTILAVYSPILAAFSLAIGCTFLTIGMFELYVSLKEGDYKRAALMGILLILGFKGVVGEVNALKAGAASIKSGGNIAVKAGYSKGSKSSEITGTSYDINKLKKTQPYVY